jgi:hypothetical protein
VALHVNLKRKLTPYHSKPPPPHLYDFPKIHKPDVPLRPRVSPVGSPYYTVAEFLQKILAPLIVQYGLFRQKFGTFCTSDKRH